jgi:tRNA pseudouridine38-40 synthase
VAMADDLRETNRTFPTQLVPRRLRLTLGYTGTRFAGWARQNPGCTRGRPTLQATLESALHSVLGHSVRIIAAGRTDAGVHAEGQVVSFDTTASIPAEGLRRALSMCLPEDVWIVEAAEAPAEFDSRRSARRRWYRYAVCQGECPPAAWRGRCFHHTKPLELAAMRCASRALLGRRNMAALVGAWGRDARPGRSTIRTVYAADWLEMADDLLIFEVCADAFLRQMVRAMVGSLLWVGQGRWTPNQLAAALATADRRAAGPTAPAIGLTLWKIEY